MKTPDVLLMADDASFLNWIAYFEQKERFLEEIRATGDTKFSGWICCKRSIFTAWHDISLDFYTVLKGLMI